VGKLPITLEESMEHTSNIIKGIKRKNHNMSTVGLGYTRILIDYVQKSPRTLYGPAVRLQLE
jgi:hypothetical protein